MHMGSLAIIGTQAPSEPPSRRHQQRRARLGRRPADGGARDRPLRDRPRLRVPVCRSRSTASRDCRRPIERLPGRSGPAMLEMRVASRAHTDAGRPGDDAGREQGRLHGGALVWRRIAAGSTTTRRASWSGRAEQRARPPVAGELSSSPRPVRPNAGSPSVCRRLLDSRQRARPRPRRAEPDASTQLDATIDAAARRHGRHRRRGRGRQRDRHRQGPRPGASAPGASTCASSSRARCPPTPSRSPLDRGPDHGGHGERGDAVRDGLGRGRRSASCRSPTRASSRRWRSSTPTLTLELGWEQTLSSGLDAYVQCLEAICNRNANTGDERVRRARARDRPRRAADTADRPEPRSTRGRGWPRPHCSRAWRSAHTRTALAHSMSYPITAHFGVPHGLACALVLPAVLEFNLEADDGRLAVGRAPSGARATRGAARRRRRALPRAGGRGCWWLPTCRPSTRSRRSPTRCSRRRGPTTTSASPTRRTCAPFCGRTDDLIGVRDAR